MRLTEHEQIQSKLEELTQGVTLTPTQRQMIYDLLQAAKYLPDMKINKATRWKLMHAIFKFIDNIEEDNNQPTNNQ